MSAPDTKALPPAPVITTTRTSSSLAKSSMIRLAASHMSNETALWRSGLLKIMYPMRPALRDSILSVWVMRKLRYCVSPSLRGGRRPTKQSRPAAWDCFGVLRTPRNDARSVSRSASDRVGLAQGGDLLCAVAELLEHRAGVLAERGRRRVELARRAREPERLADQRELALFHRLRHADMLDLRVGEHLVDRIDRPARHPRLVEPVDPLGAAALDRMPVDLGIERVAVLGAAGAGRVIGIGHHVGRLDGLAEAFPDLLPGRRDVDMAVGRLEHARRDAGRVIVAGLLGDLPADQVTRGLEVEHEDLRLQQRRLDVLALARLLALQQRGENTHRAEQPGGQVGDRDADPHRPVAGQPGD